MYPGISRCEPVHDILRVAVVLYLTLIDAVDYFPPAIRDPFNNEFDIL